MGFFFFFLFFIIQFYFPFFLPFFKLFFGLFILKEILNGGQQCSCNRVKLIVGYSRGVLALFRQPIKLPPYPLNSKTIINIICTTSSIGVNQKKKV